MYSYSLQHMQSGQTQRRHHRFLDGQSDDVKQTCSDMFCSVALIRLILRPVCMYMYGADWRILVMVPWEFLSFWATSWLMSTNYRVNEMKKADMQRSASAAFNSFKGVGLIPSSTPYCEHSCTVRTGIGIFDPNLRWLVTEYSVRHCRSGSQQNK